MGSFIKLR